MVRVLYEETQRVGRAGRAVDPNRCHRRIGDVDRNSAEGGESARVCSDEVEGLVGERAANRLDRIARLPARRSRVNRTSVPPDGSRGSIWSLGADGAASFGMACCCAFAVRVA